MKLTTITNVSVDGVTQGHRRIDAGTRPGLGAPDEERSGGFDRFGWAPPLLDDEASTFIDQAFQRADAFLFGRRTYEIFAGSWGAGMDPRNPIGAALNARPKYVVSTTLTDPQWADTTVLSSDVAAAVGELRARPGGELQVWGSGTLIRWLLVNGLVDQIVLLTYPVVIGQGTRLFPASGPDIGLELVDLRSTPKGLTLQTYRTNGRPQYEMATVT
jgi:dihydrofolate reductase